MKLVLLTDRIVIAVQIARPKANNGIHTKGSVGRVRSGGFGRCICLLLVLGDARRSL